MILIRPAKIEDVFPISDNLRDEDRAESAVASGGLSPSVALLQAFKDSQPLCLTVWETWDGNIVRPGPIAMFGVVTAGPGRGFVWFLGTDAIKRQSRWILKEAPGWLDFLQCFYAAPLYALAEAHNALHLKWCEAVGFSRVPERDASIDGYPFLYIER